jgi:FAD:protein FMN transferase
VNLLQWYQRLAPVARSNEAAPAETGQTERAARSDRVSHNALIKDTLLLSIERDAMACQFEVLLNQYQYMRGAEYASEALELVGKLEAQLSIYKPRSELSTLNRFGHLRPTPLSSDTLTMLELAIDLYRLTGGAFDITAGSLSEVWGFSRRAGEIPTPEQLQTALQTVGSQHLEIDSSLQQARLKVAGVKVNPGGIGKGYALDRAAGRLLAAGINDFMIHGGLSSVVARGDRRHSATGGGWLVALKHPWRWEETLGMIRLKDQALGTSGSGKQFFHFGGQRYSHIVDPRSGWPAQGMMSATVICPSGAVADALATAMFVLGVDHARDFCQRHPTIAAILVHASPSGRLQIDPLNLPEESWIPCRE